MKYVEEEQGYLGSSSSMKHMSAETSKRIDDTIREISDRCYKVAYDILVEHREQLEMMKDALMEYETIDAAQIEEIMQGKKPSPPKDWGKPVESAPALDSDTDKETSAENE